MELFHVKLEIIFIFKMLLADVAFVIGFKNSFVAELLQVFLQHSKIVKGALVSV